MQTNPIHIPNTQLLFTDMARSGWPDRRKQAIKYLGEVTTHAEEFIELLIELDMQNMAPQATPLRTMYEETTRVDPRQQNSEKGNHLPRLQKQPCEGGTMQQTGGIDRRSRDPRLRQRHPTDIQSKNTQLENWTTATGKNEDGRYTDTPPTRGGDGKSKKKSPKQDPLESRKEERDRKLANQGLKQREESLERWEEKTVQYMEYLTNKGEVEAFIKDEYWHSLPDRINRAERRRKKYERRLKEFLTVERTTGEGRRLNLQICDICGRIFLERRRDKDSLAAHMHDKH